MDVHAGPPRSHARNNFLEDRAQQRARFAVYERLLQDLRSIDRKNATMLSILSILITINLVLSSVLFTASWGATAVEYFALMVLTLISLVLGAMLNLLAFWLRWSNSEKPLTDDRNLLKLLNAKVRRAKCFRIAYLFTLSAVSGDILLGLSVFSGDIWAARTSAVLLAAVLSVLIGYALWDPELYRTNEARMKIGPRSEQRG